MLRHLLSSLPQLHQSLQTSSSAILVCARQNLHSAALDELQLVLAEDLNDEVFLAKAEARMQTQRLHAIRPGKSGLLDAARTIHTENIQDIVDLFHQYVGQFPHLPLKMKYDSRRGYYLTMAAKSLPKSLKGTEFTLPALFLQVSQRGGASKVYTFTTAALASLNAKHQEILEEIMHLSDQLTESVIVKVREHTSALYAVADSLAYVDMILSFVSYARSDSAPFCIPKLFKLSDTDSQTRSAGFSIVQGRHPIMTSTAPTLRNVGVDFMPTNFDLLRPRSTTMVAVLGPNSSGKTTYITQVAQVVVLAQIGCFVPAKSATLPIIEKIFCRLGSQDNIERNSSTFMSEMQDLAFVLQNATNTSLVILDELGRSTTPEEGEAIFLASCESLVRTGVITLLSTHFQQMSLQLQAMYADNVKLVQFGAEEYSANPMSHRNSHLLHEGTRPIMMSAIEVARRHGLPGDLVAEAYRLREKLIAHTDTQKRERQRNRQVLKARMGADVHKAQQLHEHGDLSEAALSEIKSRYDKKLSALLTPESAFETSDLADI